MPDTTENHDLQLWEDGAIDWEHRADMEHIDVHLEMRGPMSDRPDSPPEGSKYIATDGDDRGSVYLYEDDEWQELPHGVQIEEDGSYVAVSPVLNFRDMGVSVDSDGHVTLEGGGGGDGGGGAPSTHDHSSDDQGGDTLEPEILAIPVYESNPNDPVEGQIWAIE